MQIQLENIGRRFNREWIFKNLSYMFVSGQSYAILGPNGSGKSTLVQLLSGSLTPSTGTIHYTDPTVDVEDFHTCLSLAAPYLELIEEFTLTEMLEFHFKFKRPLDGITVPELISLLGYPSAKNKQIKYFSSGMKQRVKLILALFSDVPVVMLDEPTANLDQQGISWYLELVNNYRRDRLFIVCSNQIHEYEFCEQQLSVTDFK